MLDLSKEMNDLDVLCMLGEGAFGSVKLVVYVPSRAPYAAQETRRTDSRYLRATAPRSHIRLTAPLYPTTTGTPSRPSRSRSGSRSRKRRRRWTRAPPRSHHPGCPIPSPGSEARPSLRPRPVQVPLAVHHGLLRLVGREARARRELARHVVSPPRVHVRPAARRTPTHCSSTGLTPAAHAAPL